LHTLECSGTFWKVSDGSEAVTGLLLSLLLLLFITNK